MTIRKDLETLKQEWKKPAEVCFEGDWDWQEGYLRIYREQDELREDFYTAQYFFTLGDFGWQISVDLERVGINDLIKYLIKGRGVACEAKLKG